MERWDGTVNLVTVSCQKGSSQENFMVCLLCFSLAMTVIECFEIVFVGIINI